MNQMENAPLKDMKLMQKEKHGLFDIVTDISNITAIRWRDKKLSMDCPHIPVMQYVKRICHSAKKKVDIEQLIIICEYNKSMEGVDHMDQNIAAYKINLRSNKWWWPPFHFVIDVSVKNAFQLYQMKEVEGGENKLYALRFGRVIVDAYFRLYQQSKSFEMLFCGSQKLHPANNLCYDAINHWLVKGSQRRCAMEG